MTDPAPRWISVVAQGEGSIAPDMAVTSVSVSAKGRDLAATRADVNRRTSQVLTVLRKLGVADGDIAAPDIGIHPEYDYRRDAQKLVGYLVTRSVSARVRNLETLGEVLDSAVAAGANELHGVEMRASDPAAAEHEALRTAVAAARAKALAIAEAAGIELGRLARLEEEPDRGGPPIPKMRMMAAAESADVPTEVAAGELTVTRRIRAWFEIS